MKLKVQWYIILALLWLSMQVLAMEEGQLAGKGSRKKFSVKKIWDSFRKKSSSKDKDKVVSKTPSYGSSLLSSSSSSSTMAPSFSSPVSSKTSSSTSSRSTSTIMTSSGVSPQSTFNPSSSKAIIHPTPSKTTFNPIPSKAITRPVLDIPSTSSRSTDTIISQPSSKTKSSGNKQTSKPSSYHSPTGIKRIDVNPIYPSAHPPLVSNPSFIQPTPPAPPKPDQLLCTIREVNPKKKKALTIADKSFFERPTNSREEDDEENEEEDDPTGLYDFYSSQPKYSSDSDVSGSENKHVASSAAQQISSQQSTQSLSAALEEPYTESVIESSLKSKSKDKLESLLQKSQLTSESETSTEFNPGTENEEDTE